jgi:hypothetical protein
LYNNSRTKKLHQKFYKAAQNTNVPIKNSSIRLKNGNIPAKREASLCFLQDKNMFLGKLKNVLTVEKHRKQWDTWPQCARKCWAQIILGDIKQY